MRRRGKGNKIVKNCIVWAMSAMIAVGSIAPAQVVRAEGTEQTQQITSMPACDNQTDQGAPDAKADEFNDDEAKKNADSNNKIKDMTQNADTAESIAAADETLVDNTANQVNGIDTASAPSAAAQESTDAAAAATKANAALTAAGGLIDGYNNTVKANQADAEKIANQKAVVKVDILDGEGNPVQVEAAAADYARVQAGVAETAKSNTKTILETALAVDPDDPARVAKIDKQKKAADKQVEIATNAVTETQKAFDSAAADYNTKITEYNKLAYMYGQPAYSYTDASGNTVTDSTGYPLTSEEAAKLGITDQIAKAKTEAEGVENVALNEANDAIKLAGNDKTTAENAYNTAVSAVSAANAAVNTLKEKLGDGTTAGTDVTAVNNECDSLRTNNSIKNRDEYIQQVDAAYNNKDLSALEKAVNDKLAEMSLDVNQTQYDKAANTWGNGKLTDEQFKDAWNQVLNSIKSQKIDNLLKPIAKCAYDALVDENGKPNTENVIIAKTVVRYEIDHSDKYEYKKSSDATFMEQLVSAVTAALKDGLNAGTMSQLIVSTKDKDEVMDKRIAEDEDALTQNNEKKQLLRGEDAKLSIADSASQVSEIGQNLASKEQQLNLPGVESTINQANTQLENAKSARDAAKTKLEKLKDAANDDDLSMINLLKLKGEILKAQVVLAQTEKSLTSAKNALASAESNRDWTGSLNETHYSLAFGQAATILNEKGQLVTVDKDGNPTTNQKDFVIATINADGFDSNGDLSVKSQEVKSFTQNLANQEGTPKAQGQYKGQGTTVIVPYSIYRAYVKRMSNVLYNKRFNGQGISTTPDGVNATMPTVFWALDDNGKLTGISYSSKEAKPDGNYLVGYAFKQYWEGFHIDGLQVKFTNPVTEPTPTPGQTVTVTTIANESTALAATPAVLGARRTPIATAASAVLGASRAEDGKAVLGAKRGAATGDDSNAAGWIALMVCTAGAGAVVMFRRRKEQENAQ